MNELMKRSKTPNLTIIPKGQQHCRVSTEPRRGAMRYGHATIRAVHIARVRTCL